MLCCDVGFCVLVVCFRVMCVVVMRFVVMCCVVVCCVVLFWSDEVVWCSAQDLRTPHVSFSLVLEFNTGLLFAKPVKDFMNWTKCWVVTF